jgi:hypothetical protein
MKIILEIILYERVPRTISKHHRLLGMHHPLENFQLEKNIKVDSPENDLPVIEFTLSDMERKYSHDYFADKESKREVSHVSEIKPSKRQRIENPG